MPRFSVRQFSLFGLAFVLALHIVPTGSTAAYGACGDYVHLGRHAEPPDSAASHNNMADLESTEWARQPVVPPCHGPTCRSEDPAPTVPLPVQNSGGPDQKAWLKPEMAPAPVVRRRVSFATIAVPDILPDLRIERPPRNCT